MLKKEQNSLKDYEEMEPWQWLLAAAEEFLRSSERLATVQAILTAAATLWIEKGKSRAFSLQRKLKKREKEPLLARDSEGWQWRERNRENTHFLQDSHQDWRKSPRFQALIRIVSNLVLVSCISWVWALLCAFFWFVVIAFLSILGFCLFLRTSMSS